MAYGAHSVPARHHGLPLAIVAGGADGVHEGRADRRNRVREQLDRVRDPPGAGPNDGGPADRRDGQAQLEAAHRSADRGVRSAARAGERSQVARLGQHDAVEGISWRRAGDDRREQCGGPALDGGAVPVPRRDRRLSGRRGRRGRSNQPRAGPYAHVRAAEGVHGLDAEDHRHEPDRGGLRGERPAAVLGCRARCAGNFRF